jgi:uncharacterized BrkB/YihY/UPF0761 family membrane protein
MSKIDKLKTEADILKGYLFYMLGFTLVLMGGFGTLYLKMLDKGLTGGIVVGFVIIALFLKISVIIFIRIKAKLDIKLEEIEREV